jgi:hypothetical protein
MPSFQISDPPPTATLAETTENGRALAKATVNFVVENKTPVKRAALAKIIPEAQDDPGIYVIEGASSTMPTVRSLDFDPNLSQTVKVTITVPRAEVAKKGAFHLRVTNDPETDDDAVDSRPVAFEAAALAAAPAVKRPFPWWALIAAAAILVVAGVGVWWVFFRTSYPSLDEIRTNTVGQPLAAAVAYVESKLMTAIPQEVPTGPREPRIVDTAAVVGKNVTLTFDPGVVIPPLVGEGVGKLRETFDAFAGRANMEITATTNDPNECSDIVTVQQPPAGEYKSHKNFFFHVRNGTKSRRLCLGIIFDFELEDWTRLSPDIVINPGG